MTIRPQIEQQRAAILACGWLLLCGLGCQQTVSDSKPTPVPTAPGLDEGQAGVNAPETFRVKFTTTKGDFVVAVHRDWAPNGADRFRELVETGYYDKCKFFRVIDDFMVQWGIHGDPAMNVKWRDNTIPDDPVVQPNQRGYITYAKGGPDTRTTQVFINFKDNTRLDADGFSPFGKVVEGMDVVDSLNKEYGDAPSEDQPKIQEQGNALLDQKYPRLDGILTARIVDKENANP